MSEYLETSETDEPNGFHYRTLRVGAAERTWADWRAFQRAASEKVTTMDKGFASSGFELAGPGGLICLSATSAELADSLVEFLSAYMRERPDIFPSVPKDPQ